MSLFRGFDAEPFHTFWVSGQEGVFFHDEWQLIGEDSFFSTSDDDLAISVGVRLYQHNVDHGFFEVTRREPSNEPWDGVTTGRFLTRTEAEDWFVWHHVHTPEHLRGCRPRLRSPFASPAPEPLPDSKPSTFVDDRGSDSGSSEADSHLDKRHTARHTPDFRSVYWFGDSYEFTALQAACVKFLWEAWENKTPAVGEQAILVEIESHSTKLRDVFRVGRKFHPAWGTLIVPANKGAFRLSYPKAQ